MWWLLVAWSTSMQIFWFILWQLLPNPHQVFQQKVLIEPPVCVEIHHIWNFTGETVKCVVKKGANITWINARFTPLDAALLSSFRNPSKPFTHRELHICKCTLWVHCFILNVCWRDAAGTGLISQVGIIKAHLWISIRPKYHRDSTALANKLTNNC